jgi:hypothetical protein
MNENNYLPVVASDTSQSIVEEVFAKNNSIGVKEFVSSLEDDNRGLAIVLWGFVDSIADVLYPMGSEQSEELCAVARMACHLLYKSLHKQAEIDEWSSQS